MNKIRVVHLFNNNNCEYNLQFKFCAPGHYRISNIPNIANKNIQVHITYGFWMQEITVSVGLWEFVLGKTDHFFPISDSTKDLYPFHGISFDEIEYFLNQINILAIKNDLGFTFDCPSFVEWEHALLCGKDGIWSWGEDERLLSKFAWFKDNSGNQVHLSKQKEHNEWGLYDMYGNVHEYCYDVNLMISENPVINPLVRKPKFGDAIPCLGGAYDSSVERCAEFNVMGFGNEFVEPTGFRLVIR